MITIAGSGLTPYDVTGLNVSIHSGRYDRIVLDRNYEGESNRKTLEGFLNARTAPSPEGETGRIFFGTLLDCRDRVLDFIKHQRTGHVLYIVTGSPVFFSGAASLIRFLETNLEDFDRKQELEILNNESILDRIVRTTGLDLREVDFQSLHGRRELDPDRFLKKNATVLLCDVESPVLLADALRWFSPEDVEITLFSRMGYPDEMILSLNAQELAEATPVQRESWVPFSFLVERRYGPEPVLELTEDTLFCDPGMITKPGKRAAILKELKPEKGMRLWDVGAGSGSVGMEAALFYGVFPTFFEKNSRRIEHIEKNLKKFRVPGAKLRDGNFLEFLEQRKNSGTHLDAPHRIFVGGGGKDLAKRLPELSGQLAPEGRMICAYVTLNHMAAAVASLEAAGIEFRVGEISETHYRSGELMIGESSRPLFLIVVESGNLD